MKNISELNDMEALLGFRQLTETIDTDIDLSNEENVRTFVKRLAEKALVNQDEVKAFMELFDQPEAAANLARACLESVQEKPTLLESDAGQIAVILENPPRTQQMDLGFSLGLLALAGMAMFLSGSLKIKTKDIDIEYVGSENVSEIFRAILPKISSWNK